MSTAELAETRDSVFGNISAKVIYQRIKLDYGNDIEIHERIKIYNKEGFEHSNWEILFNDISHLQAYTYNLENNVIQKTHVTKESIFKENVYGDYEVTKITFPNVKAGSVIELTYKVDIGRLYEISIQKRIPVKNFRLVVQNAQKWMEFKQNPNFPIQLVEEEKSKKKLVVYTGKEIPPLKDAPYVNNMSNYKGKTYIKYKNKNEDKKWGQLTNSFNNAYWFGMQLETKPFFKNDINKIIKNRTDSLTMAKEIYAFLKNRMVYNGNYGQGSYDLKEVYKTKCGDKSDINMILTLILRWAGFEANPMVIGCKHKGEVLFAEVRSFNATISALQIDDEFYLLDASERYDNFGQIPIDLMNGYGLILKADGSSISFPTETKVLSVSRSSISAILDVATNTVSGTSRSQLTNYLAWEYRELTKEEDAENIAEELESSYDLLTIDNFKEKDINNSEKPVVISYDFTYEDAIEEINGDLYVAPFLFLGEKENKFDEENRLYPIDMEFPYLENYSINFLIPEGYKVTSLPESRKVKIENGVGSLSYICSASNTNIQVSLTVKLNYSLIPAAYYGGLQSLYAEYVEVTKSKIMLSKF
ncbi:MAG: DUF3857 domain-containing protein [Flavobacteriaceae bacterium]|nr:DUF3857 domain-containing protein [Flavobacteriaceae bacterium]